MRAIRDQGPSGVAVPTDPRPAPAPTDGLLDVSDLSVSYGGVQALRGVSLTVPEAGIVAVLGNNGAGKSTLLRAMSAVLPMHGGTVERGGVRPVSYTHLTLPTKRIV